ncbi:MAG: ferredoxin, partial [Anaerolineales bacterium]
MQNLSNEFSVGDYIFLDLTDLKDYTIDRFSASIQKDDSKCIRCQRCVRTCEQLQGVNALTVAYKGNRQKISTFEEISIAE